MEALQRQLTVTQKILPQPELLAASKEGFDKIQYAGCGVPIDGNTNGTSQPGLLATNK
jgi:hypothetical protein